MARSRAGLLGAAGETGTSILEALIQDATFEIIALIRPASLTKPANIALKDRGVELRALDLEADEASIAGAIEGLDILISAIGPRDQLAQIPLVSVARKANLKRFVPCGFAPIVPVGVHQSRDQKEEVYNFMKRLHIPYTIIDVGWWYQFSLPQLPSGKIDYAMVVPFKSIPGDGNVASARTDLRDIGKYVVRAIKDERTMNKTVFVYNELWTTNQIYDLLEKLSGETVPRTYTSAEQYDQQIEESIEKLAGNPKDFQARAQKVLAQYCLSWGIRGENTPEYAKYLGYLDGKALYPDVKFTPFETYLQEVLRGEGKSVYEALKPVYNKS